MEVPESSRNNFAELKRRVIQPAVAELVNKDNMIIEWEGTKEGGRRIQNLVFRFQVNPQQKLELHDDGSSS